MKSIKKPTLAISIGDLNGIGIEIALKAHQEILKVCHPIYCINKTMLQQAIQLLNTSLPKDFTLFEIDGTFTIHAGKVDAKSGRYAYDSFMAAINLCQNHKADGIVTMPIHKEAWMEAGLTYKGHTDLLRQHFNKDAIMMLGCSQMFVALYTEHIPLSKVTSSIKYNKLLNFFRDFHHAIGKHKVAVLGVNPHAGDHGVLGNEEREIEKAIQSINKELKEELFVGCIVPDVAFTPTFRKNFHYFIAMYHDQGLAPLKALYFDESVNISLNLPIIRTSVDHGTAFDIAYKNKAHTLSYINAVNAAIQFINT